MSLVVLSLVAIPAFAGKYNKVVSVGDKAPDFSGLPAVENGEQNSLTLSDIKEDVVVVVFLAQSLPGRQGVRRSHDRLHQRLQGQGRQGRRHRRVTIMDSDKLPGIKEYMKEHKSNYIYGYDESQAIGKAYGATNTPQFFVLDKERKIRYTGAMDDSQTRRQGHQDLPPRRGRCRAQGREPRRSKKPGPRAAACQYKRS